MNFRHSDSNYDLLTKDGKIVVPKSLQKQGTQWYHDTLLHPGGTRLEATLRQHYCWTGLKTAVNNLCGKCDICQRTKPKTIKYGKLPPKENPEVIPWHTVCIDLIGPYTIGTNKTNEVKLHCLTMIDPATGWFEIIEVPNKRTDEISNLFEMTWLNRYPWPTEVVMDRGKEFMGEVRTMLKDEYGIKRKPITTRNPQANAMVERAHQTIHNMIRAKQIRTKQDLVPYDGWKGILGAVGFAMRATVHSTNQATASQLVFGRDAMLNVSFEADWQYIKQRKQRMILQNNKRENKTRREHVYSVGDKVLIEQDPNRKHGKDRYKGPYEIVTVNDNGTVRLTHDTPRGGVVQQTWNIRQIAPYKT